MTDYPIDVVRSARRKRTVSASLREGRVKVMVPAGLEPDEETKLVEEIAGRVIRKATSRDVDLVARAGELAERYDLPEPTEIKWSTRQKRQWGSCSPGDSRIRVSNRLATMPSWVLDYVLIHEMAHLEVADHGPRFRELVERYELSERATGYLMAVGALDPPGGDGLEQPKNPHDRRRSTA